MTVGRYSGADGLTGDWLGRPDRVEILRRLPCRRRQTARPPDDEIRATSSNEELAPNGVGSTGKSTIQEGGGTDQGEMREGLGEVSKMLAAGAKLFGI